MALSDYKTALVTGASSGIGAACVRQLAAAGLQVTAVARRAERLAELAGETGCQPLALDVNDTAAIYRLAGREIDVLVNNAGLTLGMQAGFFGTDPDDIAAMIDVNLTAALHLVRALTPGMIERRRGHIVSISSLAGRYPLGFSAYGASKGGIHLFSQHLRMELVGTGVRHTEIRPGRTATEIFDQAFDDPAERDAFNAGFKLLSADDVAGAIYYALDTPTHANVSLIEITPIDQAPGGAAIARRSS